MISYQKFRTNTNDSLQRGTTVCKKTECLLYVDSWKLLNEVDMNHEHSLTGDGALQVFCAYTQDKGIQTEGAFCHHHFHIQRCILSKNTCRPKDLIFREFLFINERGFILKTSLKNLEFFFYY